MSERKTEPKPDYWRSFDEREGTEAFLRHLEAEFPGEADVPFEGMSRRRFLQVMSASIALAGLSGCRWPQEEIIPFGKRPEGYQPGRISHYATTLEWGGVARPVLAASYDGRPIKIEGNPDHPASAGATDVFAQAAVLELYDPDRARRVRLRSRGHHVDSSWETFEAFARDNINGDGTGLRVLAERNSSPSRERLRRELARRFPRARWHEYEAVDRGAEEEGLRLALGRAGHWWPRLEEAQVVVDLDADLFGSHPGAVSNARGFASGRRLGATKNDSHGPSHGTHESMNRLYAFEPSFTVTGSSADHRAPTACAHVGAVAAWIAAEIASVLGSSELGDPGRLRRAAESATASLPAEERDRLMEVAQVAGRDLAEHPRAAFVAVGPRQPAAVHALVARVLLALDAPGHTARFVASPVREPAGDLAALVADMEAGGCETLVMLGGNPAYDAPAEFDFARRLEQVPRSVHLSLHRNETSRRCTWHLPRTHALESWNDARAIDGSHCAVQPLIRPLFDGRSDLELLALLAGGEARSGHAIVRDTFHALRGGRGEAPEGDLGFERAWQTWLRDGFRTAPASNLPLPAALDSALAAFESALGEANAGDGFELLLGADTKVFDGRFANNAWLQELPDPLTKLTWDNAAVVSPALADELGLEHGDLVRLRRDGRTLELPTYVLPGQARHTVSVSLGYGRTEAGRVGTGVGFDAYALRSAAQPWGSRGWSLERTGRHHELACTQDHHAIDPRGYAERERRVGAIVREGDLEHYNDDPHFVEHLGVHHPPLRSLWKEHEYEGHRWGMAIDLNACTGCNACVVACQAENNIPVVGKEQVLNGREMQWLRLDRYFQGDPASPTVASQPMACTHCELAPCEQVCPVGATMHSAEGLNVMAYNRCVGTRYCSNNCPYKVRRFNFFNYQKGLTEVEQLAYNPEVTVRARGVMEKCTYCVQRIEHARIKAKTERRAMRDGDVVTACEQTCPTQAIVFGDLSDPESRVSKWQGDHRSYSVLAELNLKPRTTYLARIRNPHPELAAAGHDSEHDAHGGVGHHG